MLIGPIANAITRMNNRATAALGDHFEGRVLRGSEERFVFGDLFDVDELNEVLEVVLPQLLGDLAMHQDETPAVVAGIWTRAMVVGALHERSRREC